MSERSENIKWEGFQKNQNENIHTQPTNVNWSWMTNNELALAKSGVEAVNQKGSSKMIKQDGLMGKHSIINTLAGYSNVNSTILQGRKSKDSMRDATDAERELKIAKREGWEMFTQFKGSSETHA
jgi:hypothetical protein